MRISSLLIKINLQNSHKEDYNICNKIKKELPHLMESFKAKFYLQKKGFIKHKILFIKSKKIQLKKNKNSTSKRMKI